MTMLLALGMTALSAQGQAPKIGVNPPKLVLLISIDQFRADYIDRYAPHFLPAKGKDGVGGFRYLTEKGTYYIDAHHNHVPTATGPGHATLMTGSEPAVDGIAGNDWYDRSTKKVAYCVDDPTVKTVGGKSKPMSPANLKVTTVGDELKLATNGHSKVVGISYKDRAAILMAGHAADTVIWFDVSTGNFVTSTFYAPSDQLPQWVKDLNDKKIPEKALNKVWEPTGPDSAYELTRRAPFEKEIPGKRFSHVIEGKKPIDTFTRSGLGQDYIFDTVDLAIDAEKLGQHDTSDILVVNLATYDYVGHAWGPNSPEILDIALRTDRGLSRLFNKLDRQVGLKNVAIVLTADHGVVPIVEESAAAARTQAQRISEEGLVESVEKALTAKFGAGQWIPEGGLQEQNLYLNHELIASKGLKLEEVSAVAADAAKAYPGMFVAFTSDQILKNQLPNWDWVKLVPNGFNPKLSGDVFVFGLPGNYFGDGTGTGHGAPWAYDSHVPVILAGYNVPAQKVGRRVYTADIASTISKMLGIEYPTGNLGRPLYEALGIR